MMRSAAVALLVARFCVYAAASQDPLDYFPPSARTPYVSWYQDRGVVNYEHSTFLPSSTSSSDVADGTGDGVAVHWEIDPDSSTLRLAVAAPASGWAAFGLAEGGGMPGSDIVMFQAADPDAVMDAHVKDSYAAPTVDSSQDWTLLHSEVSDGFVIFEAERALDTNDPQDRPITYDGKLLIPPHRVIAAWGDTPDVSYHGTKRARSALRFYPVHGAVGRESEVFADAMAEEAEGYVDLTIEDYIIPQDEATNYADVCWSYEDLLAKGMPADVPLHIIGFEPLIESYKHLHHIVMFGAYLKDELNGCSQMELAFSNAGMSMAWSYAPGGVPYELPDVAGVPFGEDGFTYFYANMHYDNRWGDEGVVDNSGVRVYYTSKKRQYDMGVMQLGDPLVTLSGKPVGQGLTRHDFDCPSSCTSTTFQEEVTVYKEIMHMHEIGATMANEILRDGEVVRRSSVEYWDFEQQGLYEVPQDEFVIKPGDGVRTSCFFNATIKESESADSVAYGYGSEDEMCISYLHYYPKQSTPLGVCGSGWFLPGCSAAHTVEALDGLDRIFGSDPNAPAASADDGDAFPPEGEKVGEVEEEEEEQDLPSTSSGMQLLISRIVPAGVFVCLTFLNR